MRQRKVLICDSDLLAAALLRPLAQAHGWSLREVRHAKVCIGLLQPGASSVFVLRVGNDLPGEMAILHQAAQRFPETAIIVICDHDNSAVFELAWDLGARFVLPPEHLKELLPGVALGFLAAGSGHQP
jgi:DNA-binding NtrC family response regulator